MNQTRWLNHLDGIEKINTLGKEGRAFLFILSYDKSKIFAQPLESLDHDILYELETLRNYPSRKKEQSYRFCRYPIPLQQYKEAFERVLDEIRLGNTYLLNLTFETPIESDFSLKEIFQYSQAKFKLYFKGEFICFSPERFVDIRGERLSTYPMKGTIEASSHEASRTILMNPKERAEHIMIVDLMRNDLGIVGKSVAVEKFRYIEQIKAGEKELLQVSSKITAELPREWREGIGTLLDQLTPAGSITGTPKRSTIDIIEKIEDYDRGFYTGVFGIFDGSSLHSAVMIRYIEERSEKLYYKSGGGITIESDLRSEYEELIEKIYLPF